MIFLHIFLICKFSLQLLMNWLQNGAGSTHFDNFLRFSSLCHVLDNLNRCIPVWKLSSLQLGMYHGPVNYNLIGSSPANLATDLRIRNCLTNSLLQLSHAGGVPSGATVFNANIHHLDLCVLFVVPVTKHLYRLNYWASIRVCGTQGNQLK